MPKGPVRRAQLVAPLGVGGITVARDGTSLIAAGLDHWFERENRDTRNIDLEEYQIEEWRLQAQLRVDHFRQAPDYRQRGQWGGTETPNTGLTIPFLRFPQWHVCPSCKRLERATLTLRQRFLCPECEKTKKRKIRMHQVRFIAMCDHGHIQDFPWREWVHRTPNPACNEPLRLLAIGSASLGGELVRCACGKERSLSGIMQANTDGTTYLSTRLAENGTLYTCRGRLPWFGVEDDGPNLCSQPLRGTLPSASNVYFAHTRSSIYLPRGTAAVPAELITLLEGPPLSTKIRMARDLGGLSLVTPPYLRKDQEVILKPFSDEQLAAALRIVTADPPAQAGAPDPAAEDDYSETAFRLEECAALRSGRQESELQVRVADLSDYAPDIARYFSRIALVTRLKETRALLGFSRIFPENERTLEEHRAMLWRQPPPLGTGWLPANVVYGEGIFLELDEQLLARWESTPAVINRVNPVLGRYSVVQEQRKLRVRPLGPRFVLLHTLAHLLMNRLTFDCGYGSSSLRERLYVSTDPTVPMAGILIYTAAGDSEGTMGGLVRMGKPGYLEPVIRRALEAARWCSADPICMEMGDHGGQGPDSCNLAACHNCALVPETACEEFNRFLDRGVAIGVPDNRALGYFDGLA